jgi:hypothetical protein
LENPHVTRITEAIVTLLRTFYPLAKRSLIDLESRERVKALGAFTDLRDVFDHYYLALKSAYGDDIDPDKERTIADNLASASEHMRRAAIEPFETALEDLLAKVIDKGKTNFVLYRLGLSRVPTVQIKEALKEARNTLSNVRQKKGQMNQLPEILGQLKAQYETLDDLEKNLPARRTLWIVLGFGSAILLGVLIGRVLSIFV